MYRESEHDVISTDRTLTNLRKTLDARLGEVYGEEIAEKSGTILMKMHGLDPSNFEFLTTVDSIVGLNKKTNDVSIDDNSNKTGKHIGSAVQESIAPVKKAIGFDYYYRKLRGMYGKEEATRLLGKVLDYSLGMSDETALTAQYSYYSMTPVMIKTNGKIEVISMKQLFTRYKKFAKTVGDEAYSIDAAKLNHKVECVIQTRSGTINHKRQTFRPALEEVNEDVDVKIWDSEKGWVELQAITCHKNTVGYTVYQTNAGDYAFVTDNHPVILADESEKNASELEIGDEILKNETLPEFDEYINIPEKLAYILGFIFGDGYCKLMEFEDGTTIFPTGHVKATKSNGTFSITQLDVDRHIVTQYVSELFGDIVWGRNETVQRHSDAINATFTSHWLSGICSHYFGMGFNENAHTKQLPNNIMNWKKKSKEAFVAGLIDSDGTVFKQDGRVDIRIKAYGLSVGLYDLLRTIEGVNGLRKRICFIKRYGNVGGAPGSDICNANSMLFGTAFKPSRGMRWLSQKLQAFSDEEFESKCLTYDGKSANIRNNKITKIVRFSAEGILTPRFREELETVYDVTTATGRFYTNGMVQHNCWAFNASLFVIGGKDFGGYRALPPENIGEYVGGLCEIVHEFSANLAGALAIGTFFFDIAHILLYKEKIDLHELRSSIWLRKSINSEYNQFIRSVNNLSRNGIESPFTNISIFDRTKIKKMLEEFYWYFPVDTLPISKPGSVESDEQLKEYYDTFLTEYIMELQDIYLDLFDKGDKARKGAPFKFPVTTVNFAKTETNVPKIIDKDFLRDICNREIFRYNIFISKGSKVASCCFRGDQEVLAAVDNPKETNAAEDTFTISSLESLYNATHSTNAVSGEEEITEVVIPTEGKSIKATVIKIDYTKPFVAIGLSDGTRMITTDNHKNAVKISKEHYADFESFEIEVGMIMHSADNPAGVEVVSVNRNIPNPEKIAYCFQIIDKDATHFNMPNGVVTHNCRLINDIEMMDVAAQSNSFGAGGSISLGSHRVVTNNTVRIALMAQTKEEFYSMVYDNMEDSAKLLKAHKELLYDLEKSGCQPFITASWIDLSRSFSTFGLLGLYETAEIFRAKFGNSEDTEGNMLRFINTTMELVSKKHGIVGNIEAIPGESFAVRLCKADQLLFPNNEHIEKLKLYSNQLFPLTVDGYSIWDRLEFDGRYNRLITGGGIVHITLLEKTTPKQCEKFILFACEKGCEHMAQNPFFSVCENGHHNIGKLESCPECGAGITDFMTRTIGYFAYVSNMNYVRRTHEVPNRIAYNKKDV